MGAEGWPVAAAAAALVLAAAAAVLALRATRRRVAFARAGAALAALAVMLAAGTLADRWRAAGAVTLQVRYDTLLLALLGVAGGTTTLLLPAARRNADGNHAAAALLSASAASLLGAALAVAVLGADPEPWLATPALRSPFVAPHLALRGIGTGLLLVGAAAALVRLADRGRASRDDAAWDRVLRGTVVLSLPLFLVAVLLGAVWHGEIWAAPWQWDLVETWPFAVVVLHLAWLHLRAVSPAGTRGSALLLAAGGLLAGGMFFLRELPGAAQSLEVYPGF